MDQILELRFTAALALGLLVACTDSLGLEGSRRALGILQIEAESGTTGQSKAGDPDPAIRWNLPPTTGVTFPESVIEAPDTVYAGQTFGVTVNTIGPSGCWAADGVDVVLAAPTVQLTAWDRHSGAEACTTILSNLGHPATLTLDQPGEWTIRASGRRVGDDLHAGISITAERTIFVRAVD